MDKIQQLKDLAELKDKGAINAQEFERLKGELLLAPARTEGGSSLGEAGNRYVDLETRKFNFEIPFKILGVVIGIIVFLFVMCQVCSMRSTQQHMMGNHEIEQILQQH